MSVKLPNGIDMNVVKLPNGVYPNGMEVTPANNTIQMTMSQSFLVTGGSYVLTASVSPPSSALPPSLFSTVTISWMPDLQAQKVPEQKTCPHCGEKYLVVCDNCIN